MARSVRNVKNSLKFKANVGDGILSVRVGVKKYVVPVKARILSDTEYIFLSFRAVSELYRIRNNKQLISMSSDEDATDAFVSLNPPRRRGRRRSGTPGVPTGVMEALRNLPSGYKLGFDREGKPRLVKKRIRRISVGV